MLAAALAVVAQTALRVGAGPDPQQPFSLASAFDGSGEMEGSNADVDRELNDRTAADEATEAVPAIRSGREDPGGLLLLRSATRLR